MEINCRHGYFTFRENKVGQVSDFMSITGLKLVPKKDHYTFEFLSSAPDYSIIGKPILGMNALVTFEGDQGEVFEANQLIFDFTVNALKNINSITQKVKIQLAGRYFISDGLILPGSLTEDGGRVKDYSARYYRDSQRFYYSEVSYV